VSAAIPILQLNRLKTNFSKPNNIALVSSHDMAQKQTRRYLYRSVVKLMTTQA